MFACWLTSLQVKTHMNDWSVTNQIEYIFILAWDKIIISSLFVGFFLS